MSINFCTGEMTVRMVGCAPNFLSFTYRGSHSSYITICINNIGTNINELVDTLFRLYYRKIKARIQFAELLSLVDKRLTYGHIFDSNYIYKDELHSYIKHIILCIILCSKDSEKCIDYTHSISEENYRLLLSFIKEECNGAIMEYPKHRVYKVINKLKELEYKNEDTTSKQTSKEYSIAS